MRGTVKKTVASLLIAALCVSSLTGTSKQAEAKKKATLKTKSITLKKGKSKSIKIKNKNKKYRYTFTSNNKKVAKVSAKGKVKGVKAGTAKITVKEIIKKRKKRKLGQVKVKVTGKKVVKPTNNTSSTTPSGTNNANNTPGTSNTGDNSKVTATPTDHTGNVTPTPTPTATPVSDWKSAVLDLSSFKASTENAVTYNKETGVLHAKDLSWFLVELPEELLSGSNVKVKITGKILGENGFRSWLAADNDTAFSDIEVYDASEKEFTWSYTQTANDKIHAICIKGISWDSPIDDIEISKIEVEYKKATKPAPTKAPLPTDLPADLVPAKATTAPGELAVADKPLMYSDVPDLDYIRVGDDYYMVSTTMFLSPGVPIMHSTDLVHWEIVSYVYDTLEDNDTTNLLNGKQCYGKGSWAAALRYNENDKLFYVCFSSNDQGKFYIYTTDDIKNGKWKKHSVSGIRHDPGLLFDGDKSYIFSGNGNISMQEFTLTEDSINWVGSSKTVIQKASSDNIVSIEGSHAYKIGDYYYLMFIEWPKNGQRMEWCYRTKSLTDEWEGRVVFCSEGIAQGAIVDTKYGDWYGMLFKDNGAVGRTPVLLEVYWVDGWPVMGSNGGKASATDGMKVNLTSNGESYIYADDDFDYKENKLQLVWQWNHNPDNANWSVTEREGYLRLKTGTKADTIMNARNSLTQRTYGPKCTSEVGIDVSNMKNGDYAGICAFANSYGQVGVMKEGGKTYLYYGKGSGKKAMTVNDADKVELTQSDVKLKIDYNFTTSKASFAYSLDGTTWTTIGSNLSMAYDLTVFMGYRTYLYNYATQETGGYVDFDYYKVY